MLTHAPLCRTLPRMNTIVTTIHHSELEVLLTSPTQGLEASAARHSGPVAARGSVGSAIGCPRLTQRAPISRAAAIEGGIEITARRLSISKHCRAIKLPGRHRNEQLITFN